jgi:hypothetical protein
LPPGNGVRAMNQRLLQGPAGSWQDVEGLK